MLVKTIRVGIDRKTFPGKRIPTELVTPANLEIDLGACLLMLGQLTSPSGFSRASPMRFWAWLRYFAAISVSEDLRIIRPFVDLDPHQKTILSDDFGVAITANWLLGRLGGAASIVDGRKFVLHYSSLLERPKRSLPKVGKNKCPDYVIKDLLGKWHVLECKGTQTSQKYRDDQLLGAIQQKKAVKISRSIAGSKLAAGIFVARDGGKEHSSLRVIDPKPDPHIRLGPPQQSAAQMASARLSVSRALALSGYDRLADELAVPELGIRMPELLTSSERRRLREPVAERLSAAKAEASELRGSSIESMGQEFRGTQVEVEIPGTEFRENTGFSKVRVSQGINARFINEIALAPRLAPELLDEVIAEFMVEQKIVVSSTEMQATVADSQLYLARLEFAE